MPQIELRSEEAQEIMIMRPPNMARWGSIVFLLLTSILLLISWLIRYPNIIKAPFRLTSTNAPKSVNSKISGKLIRLLVEDNNSVKNGDVLAYLESTADHNEVLRLSSQINKISIDNMNNDNILEFNKLNFNQLGELQPSYQTFQNNYLQYISFLSNGFYSKKKNLLIKDSNELKALAENLQKQKSIYEKDFELSTSDFEAQKQLSNQKVIATLEFKREESKYLAKKLSLQQMEINIINNISSQIAKEKEILELDKTIAEQTVIFSQSVNTLKSVIEDWKKKYILVSPCSGKIYFSSFLQENQNISSGQEVFFVASDDKTEFGEVYISQNSFGKVKKSQRVLIKFKGYPFNEFGFVEGKVSFISEIPIKDSLFLAKVIFPKGLITNIGKKLTYKSGMLADAEIVTDDKRLIERLFNDFRNELSHYNGNK